MILEYLEVRRKKTISQKTRTKKIDLDLLTVEQFSEIWQIFPFPLRFSKILSQGGEGVERLEWYVRRGGRVVLH